MIVVLTYLSLICGGLLVVILLAGIIGGLDLDFDLDFDADTDPGMGDVGIVKGGLTFLSVGSWIVKMLLLASANPVVAIVSGVAAGAVAVYLMSLIVRWMLGYEENVNWGVEDALLQSGKVYLHIPSQGEGIVSIRIKGGLRELKARTVDGSDLPTGAPVIVTDLGADGVVLVSAAL